jgi:hypothetical protein
LWRPVLRVNRYARRFFRFVNDPLDILDQDAPPLENFRDLGTTTSAESRRIHAR